jgi:hypothetical protein
MKIGIQGSKKFDDYTIFLRAIGTALSTLPEGDTNVHIYSAGPSRINSFCMEFTNISERSLKARGIKIKFSKVPPSWIRENINDIDYLAYFSKPKEPVSDLVDLAEAKDIEVGIYRY